MPVEVMVFIGVVVLLGVGYLLVDLWDSRRQRRRLQGGQGRDDLDEVRARSEEAINRDFGTSSARSVGDGRNPHGRP